MDAWLCEYSPSPLPAVWLQVSWHSAGLRADYIPGPRDLLQEKASELVQVVILAIISFLTMEYWNQISSERGVYYTVRSLGSIRTNCQWE